MDLAIMVEGQNGLNWARWQRIAWAVEDLGFAGLYRSDHFTNGEPPEMDSLDLWLSLVWLADHTERIEFGSLVSPVSFRHPVHTARQAIQVDELSNGRLRIGVGAGWNEREHEMFGFDLLELKPRFQRFREGLEVITRLLRSDQPVNFDGEFYHLQDAILLPRPEKPGSPALVIGGNGPKMTLPLAAHYADEWNGVFLTAERFAELNDTLTMLIEQEGRRPQDVRRTLMTNLTFGKNETALKKKLDGRLLDDLRDRGMLAGSAMQVVADLGRLSEVGVQRVMLQWLDLDDLEGLEAMAKSVLPQVQGSNL